MARYRPTPPPITSPYLQAIEQGNLEAVQNERRTTAVLAKEFKMTEPQFLLRCVQGSLESSSPSMVRLMLNKFKGYFRSEAPIRLRQYLPDLIVPALRQQPQLVEPLLEELRDPSHAVTLQLAEAATERWHLPLLQWVLKQSTIQQQTRREHYHWLAHLTSSALTQTTSTSKPEDQFKLTFCAFLLTQTKQWERYQDTNPVLVQYIQNACARHACNPDIVQLLFQQSWRLEDLQKAQAVFEGSMAQHPIPRYALYERDTSLQQFQRRLQLETSQAEQHALLSVMKPVHAQQPSSITRRRF